MRYLTITSIVSSLTPISLAFQSGFVYIPRKVHKNPSILLKLRENNNDCNNDKVLTFTTDRRSNMKNIIFALGSSFALSNPVPVKAATKTLSEEYRQGTAAKGDTEESAPIPKSSYIKLDSGLTYANIREGTGEVAGVGKRVNIQWVLRRSDGYFVDSSEVSDSVPFIFTVGDPNGAIKGIDEGVQGMKEGGIRRLLVPPSLAYVNGVEDGKPGPVPVGFGPKQQIRRVQNVRKDVPGEYLFFEIKLTRVR